ncbi:MAG: DUF2914 domain-containing protein, partial [Chitinivibrionales bacterium]|nr:DUF2914 domain-containing protein [Chitinivibrionales bacterium]
DIARIAVCTGIADREPEGKAESFGSDVGKLYCFTHVKGVQDTLAIQHKWYHGDELRSTVPLNVRSSSWRTYSSKTLDPSWIGEWRVDVVDGESGDVLASTTFVVAE